jgi:DNA-binding transcriptional MerR regulator
MPLSRSRDYLSIGEVLETLKADFPDVSISKIRFLEAEGLIAPERTASGYRKFFDGDVKRLKYILQLQRDQFLPLKVIRDKLDEIDASGTGFEVDAPAPAPAKGKGKKSAADAAPTAVQMSRKELCSAAGMSEGQLAGLEEFGVLVARDGDAYNEDDLLVAKAAVKFFGYGVEPRHLRMYRQFAERETSFFQQIVSPVAAKRDPEGQKEAARSMRELLQLSRQLKEGVLRAHIRELI